MDLAVIVLIIFTAETMQPNCEILGHIKVRISQAREKVASKRVTWPRPPGRSVRRTGGNPPVNQNLCEFHTC